MHSQSGKITHHWIYRYTSGKREKFQTPKSTCTRTQHTRGPPQAHRATTSRSNSVPMRKWTTQGAMTPIHLIARNCWPTRKLSKLSLRQAYRDWALRSVPASDVIINKRLTRSKYRSSACPPENVEGAPLPERLTKPSGKLCKSAESHKLQNENEAQPDRDSRIAKKTALRQAVNQGGVGVHQRHQRVNLKIPTHPAQMAVNLPNQHSYYDRHGAHSNFARSKGSPSFQGASTTHLKVHFKTERKGPLQVS